MRKFRFGFEAARLLVVSVLAGVGLSAPLAWAEAEYVPPSFELRGGGDEPLSIGFEGEEISHEELKARGAGNSRGGGRPSARRVNHSLPCPPVPLASPNRFRARRGGR